MSQKNYFEQTELWNIDRFTANYEAHRLSQTLELFDFSFKSLLDVGCGNGLFISHLENKFPSATIVGLEQSSKAINSKVCKSNIILGSLPTTSFEDEQFDVVSCLLVVEHLNSIDFPRALQELQRITKKFVIIQVPFNENRLQAICPYCSCRFNPHYHMRSFVEDDFNNLFSDLKLVNLQKIYRKEIFLKRIVNPYRRTVFGKFPNNAICPQCGFSESRHRAEGGTPNLRNKIIDLIQKSLPKLEYPAEITALYRK